PVSVLARSPEEVRMARQAGAQLIMVPPDVLPDVAGGAGSVAVAVVVAELSELAAAGQPACSRGLPLAVDGTPWGGPGAAGAVAVVSREFPELAAAGELACSRGLPLAVDVTRWSGPDAVGRESAAVALGCRGIRTSDVRPSRPRAA